MVELIDHLTHMKVERGELVFDSSVYLVSRSICKSHLLLLEKTRSYENGNKRVTQKAAPIREKRDTSLITKSLRMPFEGQGNHFSEFLLKNNHI